MVESQQNNACQVDMAALFLSNFRNLEGPVHRPIRIKCILMA